MFRWTEEAPTPSDFLLRLDMNPFTLIFNALLGLHTTFVEPQLWLAGSFLEHDGSQQFSS
jgi:hypothetical protein